MSAVYLQNYSGTDKIANRILDFFSSEIVYAFSCPGIQQLWIVSPWIRNVTFDLSYRGNLDHIFPNHGNNTISLLQIIERLTELGVKVTIVSRPPHSLFPPHTLSHIAYLQKRDVNIKELIDEIHDDLGRIPVLTETTESIMEKLRQEINDLTSHIDSYSNELEERDKTTILAHAEMIELLKNCKNRPNLTIIYNERLHAKLLVGSNAALFGSANITNMGINENDELFAYVTDAAEREKLLRCAEYFGGENRATTLYPWIIPEERYQYIDFIKHDSNLTDAKIRDILHTPMPDELYNVLSDIGLPVIHQPVLETPVIENTPIKDGQASEESQTDSGLEFDITTVSNEMWTKILTFNPKCQAAIHLYIERGTIIDRIHKKELEKAYRSAISHGFTPDNSNGKN